MIDKFEYVMSGFSHTRIFGAYYDKVMRFDKEKIEYFKNYFEKMQNIVPSHKFSVLYNAFIEAKFGELFYDYIDNLSNIYADSGGLQVTTLGKVITEKFKEKVYENQSKWSTKGLCFDEIPVKYLDEKIDKNDSMNRWFDPDYKEKAKITGKNITKQITTFIKNKSKSKPIIICHGNCLETYTDWIEIILKEIPQELHCKIGGIAMGAGALGLGPLEDIKRSFYFSQLPLEDINHLHVLGVGSISRMLPYIVFSTNGLYNKDLKISYDSTTHSSGITLGRYFLENGKTIYPPKGESYLWKVIYDDISEKIGIPFSFKEFKENFFASIKADDNIKTHFETFIGKLTFGLNSVYNFLKKFQEIIDNKNKLLDLAKENNTLLPIKTLYEVKNKKDFEYWFSEIGKFIKSSKVSKEQKPSLDFFF